MTEATIRSLLRSVNSNIELDSAIVVADVINLYHDSIKRIGNRTHLSSADAIKILHIINLIMTAGEGPAEEEIQFVPKGKVASDE